MEISTQRLFIRPINISDNHAVFAYRSDSDTNRYQGWIPKTIEEVDAFIQKNPQTFNAPNTWFQLVLILKENRMLVGDFGLHFLDDNRQVEIGFTLAKKHHGKGYATEALKAVLNHLFLNLKKHRVTASVDPQNFGSIALLERLGFRKEAHFKESIYLNHKWVDDVIYAMLLKDWEQL